MLKKILKFTSQHKFITTVIIIIIVLGSYFGYKALKGNGQETRYVLAAVEKGTLITSVSGSGQVSAMNQIDIKSKVSGDVIYINAKSGQEVKTGTLLVQLDTSDVQKTIRDAEINLQREQLNLDKMNGITTDEGKIRGVKEKAEDDIEKAYEDGFNTIANIFLELPNIMSGLNNIIFSYDFETGQQNITYYANAVRNYNDKKVSQYEKDAYDKHRIAREEYDQNFQDYKLASRFSEPETTESLIAQTYETTKNIAEAIKSINNLIQFYHDELTQRGFRAQSLSDTHLSNLNNYTSKTNSYLLNLLSIKNTIQSGKETIVNTNFDIADQEIQVKEAEYSLSEAKEKINDYFIRAPFGGVITEVADTEKGDSISPPSVIATLITKQKIAEISLNEIDVAKVKIGQKVTIIFDAIDGLNISGKVAEIDVIGTVTQGVVSYNVKIVFDTQDERVKSGMSISVSVITDVKQNVLLIPNSAIKSQGDISYVETLSDSTLQNQATANVSGITSTVLPAQQQIEIGAANDSYTEVTNGLKEGDTIITQTITSGTSSTQQNNTNSFRMQGVTGGGFRPD